MTTAEAVGHFGSGQDSVTVGTGTWHYRTRQCNELTGCAEWTDIRNDYIDANLTLHTRNGKAFMEISDTPVSERSLSCNSASVDSNQVACTAVSRSYPYPRTTYRGRITNHCVRLDYTDKTDPNSSNTWQETQYVYTHRFAEAQERTFGGHSTPNQDAEPDSPFAAASCDDNPITTEAALQFFDPGAYEANFASGEWHKRSRVCNELTGCTAWDESQGFLTASTTLHIRNSEVYMELSDTPISERSLSCNSASVDSNRVACTAVSRSYPYPRTTYRGRVTDDCTRLEYVDTTDPNSSNRYTQTQYVYYQRN
jgi:hypothetical protein